MSSNPSGTRKFFRVWFPWLVLGIALGGLALLWAWPSEEMEDAFRVFNSTLVGVLTALFLLGWLAFLSGFARKTRIAALGMVAILASVVIGSTRRVYFSGNMVPIFEFRWTATREQDFEADRQQQLTLTAAVSPVELGGDASFDYPGYRGIDRSGVAIGPVIARDWQKQPPKLLWKRKCGAGYSAFAIAGNAAVTLEQRQEQGQACEVIVCYDSETGRERWKFSYPALFSETLGGNGPRTTPTIAGEDVFSLGATGELVCLGLKIGVRKWTVNILDGNDNVMWGMSGSPLVYAGVVVVNPGVQRATPAAENRGLRGYDRVTGKLLWSAGNHRAGYSSPMLASLAGVRQIVLLDGDSFAGYDATDGRELWRADWQTQNGINVAQPVVLGDDRVFISSSYGHGCALFQFTVADGKLVPKKLWENKKLRCKFTSPVEFEGFLYGLDEGILVCLDPATGDRKWKNGRYEHGQLLRTANLLVILAESGKLALVEANPNRYLQLASIDVFQSKTWNCPALANGRVYLRNDRDMACYDLRNGMPSAGMAPPAAPKGDGVLGQANDRGSSR